jgi:predicted membrane protein
MKGDTMKISKWFWGIFFICAAAAVILHALGHFADISMWSIIFTIVLIPIIISSLMRRFFAGVIFPLAIIAILFADPLGFGALSPWPILAAGLFLSIAFSIMFSKKKSFGSSNSSQDFCKKVNHDSADNFAFEESVEYIDDNEVDCQVSFGTSTKYIHCNALTKADIRCSFGALQVFFDDTKLHSNGATINADCSFGSIEIYVPKTWNVQNDATATLGAVEIHKSRKCDDEPVVILKGNASFGAIEVIYV